MKVAPWSVILSQSCHHREGCTLTGSLPSSLLLSSLLEYFVACRTNISALSWSILSTEASRFKHAVKSRHPFQWSLFECPSHDQLCRNVMSTTKQVATVVDHSRLTKVDTASIRVLPRAYVCARSKSARNISLERPSVRNRSVPSLSSTSWTGTGSN